MLVIIMNFEGQIQEMLKYFYLKHFTVKLVRMRGNDVRANSWRRLAAIASTDRRYKIRWVG
jgi:hypothetical protein